jgi:hypothetical protein
LFFNNLRFPLSRFRTCAGERLRPAHQGRTGPGGEFEFPIYRVRNRTRPIIPYDNLGTIYWVCSELGSSLVPAFKGRWNPNREDSLVQVRCVADRPRAANEFRAVQCIETGRRTAVQPREAREPHPEWPDIDLSEYDRLPDPDSMRQMHPGQPVTYWEMRRYSITLGWIVIPGGDTSRVCLGAENRVRCRADFAVAHERDSVRSECLYWRCVVTTTGGVVSVVAGDTSLIRFLSPIDTPAEAALAVHLDGAFWDAQTPKEEVGIREDSDGYLLLVRRYRCGQTSQQRLHWLVRVTASGERVRLREAVASTSDRPCPVI